MIDTVDRWMDGWTDGWIVGLSSSCVPRRLEFSWSRVFGPLQASAASLSMDRVHGTVYPQPYVHRTSRCAHSSAS